MSTARSHFKNVSSLLVSGAAAKIIVFLATLQIIKGLEVVENGIYQLAYSLGFIYSMFADLGVRGYLLRELSRVRNDAVVRQQVFSDALNLRLILSLVVLPVAVGLTALLGYSSTVIWFTFWLTVYAMLDLFAALLKFVLRAFDRMEYDPVFTMLGRGLLLAGIVYLVRTRSLTLESIAVIHIGSALIEIIGLVIVTKLVLPMKFVSGVDMRSAFSMLVKSMPFAVATLVAFLYLKIGIIVLSAIRGEEAAAYFGTAGRVPEALLFLPGALANAFIPFFTRNAADVPLIRRYFAGLLQCAALAGAVVAGVFIFETEFVIKLVAKPEYFVATTTFKLYGAWTFFAFLQLIIANLLICLGAERAFVTRYIVALVINVVLNIAFIPFWGINGAAWALLITEIVSTVYNYVLLRQRDILIPASLVPQSLMVAGITGISACFPAVPPLVRVGVATALATAAGFYLLHRQYPSFFHQLQHRQQSQSPADSNI